MTMQSVVTTHREFFPDDPRSDAELAAVHDNAARSPNRKEVIERIHRAAGTSDQETLCAARRYMLNVLDWNASKIMWFIIQVVKGQQDQVDELRDIVRRVSP
jgi:hypothetical protein